MAGVSLHSVDWPASSYPVILPKRSRLRIFYEIVIARVHVIDLCSVQCRRGMSDSDYQSSSRAALVSAVILPDPSWHFDSSPRPT